MNDEESPFLSKYISLKYVILYLQTFISCVSFHALIKWKINIDPWNFWSIETLGS